MSSCKIIPSPDVDPVVVAAVMQLKWFFPAALRELRVCVNTLPAPTGGEQLPLAEWYQQSGYREATIVVSPDLSMESGESLLQVIRHELVHGHMHQLDVFVQQLIAAHPRGRSRKAAAEVYSMLREAVADDISYSLQQPQPEPYKGGLW